MKKPLSKRTLGYLGVLAAALALAIVAGWTSLAAQIDDYGYDWMFRLNPPAAAPAHSMILAIDDATYGAMGGVRGYRAMLAKGLELLRTARPKAVAIDVILTDREDEVDGNLERAMQGAPNLVLATHLENGRWENPLPRFLRYATALGHDQADELSRDGVTRQIPLEQISGGERYWSLALEAFRLAGNQRIVESPEDVQVGSLVIPAARNAAGDRPVRVLFTREPIPQISLKALVDQPELASRFTGQTVFFGVTSINATYDRVTTPYGNGRIPGVEVHAQLFETLERGRFLTDASNLAVLGFCLLCGLLAGLIFAWRSGLPSYAAAGLLLAAAHVTPFLLFGEGVVFPIFAPLASAWLTVGAAFSYQHFIVRRQLRKAESDRQRYQQAIHFVTHEMRTPLTAIQGSSELMGRYNLSEEKRKQMADMINQESKRLARMIQTFLDVERLSDRQMELKREPLAIAEIVEACIRRAQPLAERKNIRIQTEAIEGTLEGDRELMEYAVFNLLNNAVKYSGPETTIRVACRVEANQLRLSVEDQGIGMDAKELRQIFKKFYRTKRAEASGEAGTGIGLSIVEQIVEQHAGRIEVTSQPGKGSCFTVVLPAHSRASQSPPVSV